MFPAQAALRFVHPNHAVLRQQKRRAMTVVPEPEASPAEMLLEEALADSFPASDPVSSLRFD